MDQEGPYEIFKDNLSDFLQSPPGVKLNDAFIGLLRKKHPSKNLLDSILLVPDPEVQKRQIFEYFTKGREECKIVIDSLNESGQREKATELERYNHSEPPWPYTDHIKLTVVKARTLRSGVTFVYPMGSNPRGRCLIYLMEPELKNESKRWKHIFKQMDFVVIIYKKQSCQAMANELRNVANNGIDGNAFVMMFLGHGHDEIVIGNGQVEDEMRIADIVDIFSETNAKKLKWIPKIFVFNCCRRQTSRTTPVSGVYVSNMSAVPSNLNTIKEKWRNCNKRTYILYACAEGEEAWYLRPIGLSAFGQAFSHTIAQYAWYKDFAWLGQRTHNRLEKEYGEKYFVQEDGTSISLELRPEIRLNSVGCELYFNPGLYDSSVSN